MKANILKRPLILFVITFFSLPNVFVYGGDQLENVEDQPLTIGDIDKAALEEIVILMTPGERIRLGATSKKYKTSIGEFNNRVYLIGDSTKPFAELQGSDFEKIARFNDPVYIGKTYRKTSAQLRLWMLKKSIAGISETQVSEGQKDEPIRIDLSFYQGLLKMRPLDVNKDDNLGIQEKLIRLSQHLINEELIEMAGKEDSVEQKSELIDTFYEDLAKLGLIESIDAGASPNDRLAHLLINEFLWDQARAQVWFQVGGHVGGHVGDQVGSQVWVQVGDHVWNQVGYQGGDQVIAQIGDQVMAQVGSQVWDQVEAQVEAQVEDQVSAQVRACLSKYGFQSAFDDDKLSHVLKPAIDSAFIAYQFAIISLLKSQNFKELRDRVSNMISENMKPEQISAALDGIKIPDDGDLAMVNTFLKILRKAKSE